MTYMPIRIMHVVDTLAVGGLQNGLANLIDRMDTSRFEHVVCAMRPIDEANMQRFSPGRARVMCLSTEESASRFQIGALARKIRAVEPDIVHTRNWGTGEGHWQHATWAGAAASTANMESIGTQPRRSPGDEFSFADWHSNWLTACCRFRIS